MNPNPNPKTPQGAPVKGDAIPAAKPVAAAGPTKVTTMHTITSGTVPPLYRRLDWFAALVTFAVVWIIYFCCLAPEVTLEDSGELCTASFYAGIPHPPGYPFWTIYTWFWTVLVPFKNIAWRVALAEASTSAAACGIVALIVSRGSSMLMEGIEELKSMTGKWESAICSVSGFVAGLMLALGSSMWQQSVVINRISLFGVPWLVLVMAMMLRWMYAPHQRRYLYLAFFFIGICSTIHQTLTMAIMGIEIGVAARAPRLGRDMLALNSVGYIAGVIAKHAHMVGMFDSTNPMVYTIFNAVGLSSMAGCVYLTIVTGGLMTEWLTAIISFALMLGGACFYFYEAVSGMTNPPMEWGYPRTVEGFWHAISRGQYDKLNPTDIFHDFGHFIVELRMLVEGVADAYSWVVMFFAVLPLVFIFKMQKRERAWIVSVAAIYPFLGVMLSIFLSPTRDRQTSELVKVFFTASHAVVAVMVGYGLALIAAFMSTNYEKFRRWGFAGAGVAIALALYSVWGITDETFFGADLEGQMTLGQLPHYIAQAFAPHQYGSAVIAALMLVGMTILFLIALFVYNKRAPLGVTLGLFALLPLYSGMSHWYKSEQHNHWFGYWFGHDMFTPPFVGPDGQLTYDAKLRDGAAKGPKGKMVYPEMARDAVLFGGTDPGRFCPTYTIFCESFIPHDCQPEADTNYDRRDVYIITQNALADNTYLDYIRAQYNRYTQNDPPFFQNFLSGSAPNIFHGQSRWLRWMDDIFEGIGAKVERSRRTGTSWFKPDQFLNAKSLAAKLHGAADPLDKYLYGRLTKPTQQLVDSGGDEKALRSALTTDLNEVLDGENIYSADRFGGVKLPPLIKEAAASPLLTSNNIVRLNRRMLEEAYPDAIVKSLGGVYPDTEIQTPSPDDSAQCFNDYIYDAQRRLQHDASHPNEPHEVKPNEEVRMDPSGRVQVSGQVAVMSINGLLTKVIFDKNPHHEFYVEESFPLDWMYPYLEPFGIIMHISRSPISEMPQETIDRDHAFWSEYSARTIGNWITYDTTVKEICEWAEAVYLRHDLSHFTGDPKFVRDDDGQKAFSKLRSSIASSIYQWRSLPQNSRSASERPRVTREAEFAFKQAFAYCPYSPEAVFHYMDLMLHQSPPRLDDAILILETCHKLDPYNTQISNWIEELKRNKSGGNDQIRQAFATVQQLISQGQTNNAEQLLDQLMNYPGADTTMIRAVAEAYVRIHDMPKSEQAVMKLTQLEPNSAEAWYNLGAIETYRGELPQAVAALKKAIDLNKDDVAKDPKVSNLRSNLFSDPNFQALRQTAEFKAAFGPQ